MPGIDGDLAARLTPLVGVLHPQPSVRDALVADLLALAERYRPVLARRDIAPLDERSAFLITYGDAIRSPGRAPLAALADVVAAVVGDDVSDLHLLPMFPWTSDDGFAVVDHRAVNPELGTWDDVARLGARHGLMFDFVANHVSASSPWFTGWLAGDPRYADYFVSPTPGFDASRVVRPRTTPLVHAYERPDGSRVEAWTTFGEDQVDVNVAHPPVLLDLTDVLLGYVAAGADTIRLDAIGYLWKESGTTCIHRPGTHAVVKIWRALLDALAPGARLLTETNVPHADNVAYFGDLDEAHMVYQFALPPLVLHSFVAGDAGRLTSWAAGLEELPPPATWFNFLASHDGIGMRPARGLLDDAEQAALVDRVRAHGGRASFALEPDGSRSVYELNCSYLDALVEPSRVADAAHVVPRALAAHAILLSLVGVPAIYYHSLLGSSHDVPGMHASGINRRINREQLDADTLLAELSGSPRRRGILSGLRHLLAVRRRLPAFSPYAPQEVLDLDRRVFAVHRGTGPDRVTAVVNVSADTVELPGLGGRDALTGRSHDGLTLAPDAAAWLVR